MKRFAVPLLLFLAAPATAETFDVLLGGRSLGQFSFEQRGSTATLRSTLNNTPMGVFNGTFTGTSTGNAQNAKFVGDSQSSRKHRVVRVNIAKGRADATDIQPVSEITDLSDVARVPAGVIDPVRVIGALIAAAGCPDTMKMYDGRRVVTLGQKADEAVGDTLTCNMTYRVTAGPGHLSPLGIKSAEFELTYTTGGSGQSLRQIKISSGIFRLTLNRRK